MDTKEFIEKCIQIHNGKYDYSNVIYESTDKKVKITCPEHGDFLQTPYYHIRGSGCPKCIGRNKTTEEFTKEANEIHGNIYNYSLVKYEKAHEKVVIICEIHGEFLQTPSKHLSGQGCKKCSGVEKSTTEKFIEKSLLIHENEFDYSKVKYKNTDEKVIIICKKHGEFLQSPYRHLTGDGCPNCCKNKKLTVEEFIHKSNEVHKNTYDYSKIEFVNCGTKINILCKIHGVFLQTPSKHLNGQGCSRCKNCKKLTTEEFIERVTKKHGNKFDYSKVNYVNSDLKVIIICHKHGEFEQVAWSHLNGIGCPHCQESHGEKFIAKILTENNINFIRQKRFSDCKYKNVLPFDFYLPANNLCIEHDGKQHFEPNKHFGGEDKFNEQIIKDNIKNEYCKKNKIQLIRITYKDDIEEFLLKNFFIKNKIPKFVNN